MIYPHFEHGDDGSILTAYESISNTQSDSTIGQIQLGDTGPFQTIPYYDTYLISSDSNHSYLESIREILQDIEHIKLSLQEIKRRLQENYEIDISDLI